MGRGTRAAPPIIFSVAPDYFGAAEEELHSAFGPMARIERLGSDAGRFTAEGVDLAQVAEMCLDHPLIFIQHLMAERERIPAPEAATNMDGITARALDLLRAQEDGMDAPIALQVWACDGTEGYQYRPDELRRVLNDALTVAGFTITRGGQEHILSVCLTPQQAVLGFNRTAEALTDWPGGRVGLARGMEQISRAEFKLEEIFKVFPMKLPRHGVALDLGASPGGWTHLLRGWGLTVWAVDPAELDARLAGDEGIHHVQMTASAFLAETREHFDLVLNDMRMDPEPSCRLMNHAARKLKPRGLAIVTLKLLRHHAVQTVERALAILGESYTIQHARQLSHNRHEVTVVARRRA